MSGQLTVLPTLYTRKDPLIPIEEEAGWSPVSSGHFGEKRNLLPWPWNEPWLLSPTWCRVSVQTELSWMLY